MSIVAGRSTQSGSQSFKDKVGGFASVSHRAMPSGRPVCSASRRISGWTLVSLSGRGISINRSQRTGLDAPLTVRAANTASGSLRTIPACLKREPTEPVRSGWGGHVQFGELTPKVLARCCSDSSASMGLRSHRHSGLSGDEAPHCRGTTVDQRTLVVGDTNQSALQVDDLELIWKQNSARVAAGSSVATARIARLPTRS